MAILSLNFSDLLAKKEQIDQIASGQNVAFQNAMKAALEYARATMMKACEGGISLPTSGPYFNERYHDACKMADIIYPNGSLFRGVLRADPVIAKQSEEYQPPYDLKKGLLVGPNSRAYEYKDRKTGMMVTGRYNTVPFRHLVKNMPGGLYPMAYGMRPQISFIVPGYGRLTAKIPGMQHILSPSRITVQHLTSIGLGTTGGARHPTLEFKDRGGGGYREYTQSREGWKAGKYEGMIRTYKKYEDLTAKGGSQYFTFRRVSTKSDPQSWWHPGHGIRPVTEVVTREIKDHVKSMLQEAIMA